jgi:hypothetical protein
MKPLGKPLGVVCPDGALTIEVDLKDIKACESAAELLHFGISGQHGKATANKTFAKAQASKTRIKEQKNLRLLFAADVASAAALAEINRTLPREERYGPTGTTDPATMATQIRRLRKRYSRQLANYRQLRNRG